MDAVFAIKTEPLATPVPVKVATIEPKSPLVPAAITKEVIEEEPAKLTKTEKKRGFPRWVAAVVILIIVGAIGAYFVLPMFSPQKMIVSSFKWMLDEHATTYEMVSEFSAKSDGSTSALPFSGSSKFTLDASIDSSAPGKGRILLTGRGNETDPQAELGSLEMRWLENILYLRLDVAKTYMDQLSAFGADQFAGQWYSLDTKSLIDSPSVQDQYNTKITTDQVDQLMKAYEKNQFIVVGNKLESQTIGTVNAVGYQLSYDKEKLVNWLMEFSSITNQPNALTADNYRAQIVDPAQFGTLNYWFDTKTKRPVKLEYSQTSGGYTVSFSLTIKSVGSVISVEKPEPALSLDELIQQWESDFSATTSGSLTKAEHWLVSAIKR